MNLSDKKVFDEVKQQTEELLNCLQSGKIDEAQERLRVLSESENDKLFSEVGQLTRRLHESLNSFNLESKITDLAACDMPDATERLNYVIASTENAANITMDKVEKCNEIVDVFTQESEELLSEWEKLYKRELEPGDFRVLCKRMSGHLEKNKQTSVSLKTSLSEVFMAQEYQDLTSQVIRKVITLVQDIEESMIEVIKVFGNIDKYEKVKGSVKVDDGVEGPIINADKRNDAVNGQDEVDELLSSLGF